MKKTVAIVLMLMMVLSAATVFAADIRVLVNGEEIQFDRAPELNGQAVMIPYRFVAEKLGAKVSWHQETQTVFAEYNGSIVTAQIGNNLMFVNGDVFNLENAPVLSTDRTLVPGDVFVNAMGVKFSWDEATSTVTIEK